MSWQNHKEGKSHRTVVNKELGLIAYIATGSISAFDSILRGTVIPGRAEALTEISNYWAVQTSEIPNAYIWDNDIHEAFCAETGVDPKCVTIQRLTEPLPVEAIVRGYITGSAWRDYVKGGRIICGEYLPDGLEESMRLPKAYFTPTTKAEHDENITFEQMKEILLKHGCTEAEVEYIRTASLQLYYQIHEKASRKGMIFADSKFEFGRDVNTGKILVIDEIGTPDSSRYWSAARYQVGKPQDSYDKQIIRDHISDQKKAGIENPTVSREIIEITSTRYKQLEKIITGTE